MKVRKSHCRYVAEGQKLPIISYAESGRLPSAAGAHVGGLARAVAVAGDVDVGQLGDGDD